MPCFLFSPLDRPASLLAPGSAPESDLCKPPGLTSKSPVPLPPRPAGAPCWLLPVSASASQLSSAAGRRRVDRDVASAPACPEWSSCRLPPPRHSVQFPTRLAARGWARERERPLGLPALSPPQATLSPSVTPVGVTFRSAQSHLLPIFPLLPRGPNCPSRLWLLQRLPQGLLPALAPLSPVVTPEQPPWADSTQRTACNVSIAADTVLRPSSGVTSSPSGRPGDHALRSPRLAHPQRRPASPSRRAPHQMTQQRHRYVPSGPPRMGRACHSHDRDP